MSLTSTNDPDVFGLGGDGGIPASNNIVLTYDVDESSSVSQGDWVKLSDTTNGYIQKCSATDDTPIGIAGVDVDNSDGDAGDKKCPVLRQGFAYVDAVLAASGDYNVDIKFDDALYLTDSISDSGQDGQALSATNSGGSEKMARAMDSVEAPDTTATYRIRVYLDRLNQALD